MSALTRACWTAAYTSTLVVGAGVRRSVSISLVEPGLPVHISKLNRTETTVRETWQPPRNLKKDLQLKLLGLLTCHFPCFQLYIWF